MPSRNSKKIYDSNAYYHVYNRGVDKRTIFHDDEDYEMFLSLIARYVSRQAAKDRSGREYDWLGDSLEVVAYCLMPNHFHLLIYQIEPEAMTMLLRAVTGSYTVYYNKRYDRSGTLFQGVYKASHITQESYLQHITRYIHLNPHNPQAWRWSSLGRYLNRAGEDWVRPERLIANSPEARRQYLDFLALPIDDEALAPYLADH